MLPIIPLVFLGLVSAGVVNYLGDVLPRWRRPVRPRCLHCEAPVPILHNFTGLSLCRSCGKRHLYPARIYLVVAAALAGTIALAASPPPKLGFWQAWALLIFFLVVMVIDIEHRLILHPVSLAGALLGFVVGVRVHGLWTTLLGGFVGFGTMYAMYKFGELFTRLVTRLRGDPIDEIALGFGDVNLAGVLGLMLGFPVVLLGLVLAVLIGGLFSLFYLLGMTVSGRYRSFEALPYAPFLVLAAAFILFLPDAARTFFSYLIPAARF